jgi:uncharacterized protein YecT (DUF1311 family)
VFVLFGAASALFLAGAPAGDAVEARYSPALTACLAQADGPVDTAECYRAEFKLHDTRLNAVYERLMLARSGEAKANLRYKQRAWIRAKEATCASEAIDADEETASGVAGAACYLRLTAERVTFLERMEAPR